MEKFIYYLPLPLFYGPCLYLKMHVENSKFRHIENVKNILIIHYCHQIC